VFGTIVLGYDESQHAALAAEKVKALAKSQGDKVLVVHVQPLINPGRGGPVVAEDGGEAHHVLDAAVADFKAAGIETTGQLHRGATDQVGQILIDVAAEAGAGLIAVGTRGRSDAQSLVLGSVAHDVIHRSTVPVLVVRDVNS
jgi:nucleotide-binding universal stress UspA family protein